MYDDGRAEVENSNFRVSARRLVWSVRSSGRDCPVSAARRCWRWEDDFFHRKHVIDYGYTQAYYVPLDCAADFPGAAAAVLPIVLLAFPEREAGAFPVGWTDKGWSSPEEMYSEDCIVCTLQQTSLAVCLLHELKRFRHAEQLCCLIQL